MPLRLHHHQCQRRSQCRSYQKHPVYNGQFMFTDLFLIVILILLPFFFFFQIILISAAMHLFPYVSLYPTIV